MSTEPEALRLANEFECRAAIGLDDEFAAEHDAARLLREQHAEIERLRFAVAAEREACAQVAQQFEWWREPHEIAAAIRARGER